MTQEELDQAEWEDPRNWHGGWLGLYYSKWDSRVWVPKRVSWMGWTVNTGRTGGKLFLGGILALGLAAALLGYLADR